jgi:hypothetical protein
MDTQDSIRNLLTNEIGPVFIDRINAIQSILEKNDVSLEDMALLQKWQNYYLRIKVFKSQNENALPEDLTIQINYFMSVWENVINYCYLDPKTMGKESLRELSEIKQDDSNLNANSQANANAKSKGKSLSLLKDGISYYEEPQYNPEDFSKYAGYVSTALIVAGTVILGIILAIIAL